MRKGYCFIMNTNIQGDFQIYISVPFTFSSHPFYLHVRHIRYVGMLILNVQTSTL